MSDQDILECIKSLFSNIEKDQREDFFKCVAGEFKVSPVTVRVNWFGGKFEVPARYNVRQQLHALMQRYIALKNNSLIDN